MRLRSEVLSVEREGDDFILELNGMTVGTKSWLLPPVVSMPGLGQRRLVIKLPNSSV